MFKELSTDLISAVIWGNFPAIKEFVETKVVDINQQDKEGRTALHLTLTGNTYTWGNIDTITYLLEHGANPFIRDHRGLLPVDYLNPDTLESAGYGFPGFYADLKAAAKLKSTVSPALSSDLKSAVIWQNFSAVKKFVEEEGANINQQDKEGKTALHYAYKINTTLPDGRKSNSDTIIYLVEHGGDSSIRDHSGRLPGDYLTAKMIEEKLLEEHQVLRFDVHNKAESQKTHKSSSLSLKGRTTQWLNEKCEKYFF